MPFDFDHSEVCLRCPHGNCFEDRREKPIKGRKTQFRFKQYAALNCTFEDFIPGGDKDPNADRTYADYINQFTINVQKAGKNNFGSDFLLQSGALAKVEGDVFELLEAAALWNAAAAWNRFIDTGVWSSKTLKFPPGVSNACEKIAIFQLPRGYDPTKLFKDDVRERINDFEKYLSDNGMSLGLSSPDIVGVKLKGELNSDFDIFLKDIDNLNSNNLLNLERAYKLIENSIGAEDFIFAVAVKRTIRSDRLYQPLFEANILKYLIEVVLKGNSFRFYAHLNSFDGADVVGHYKSASLVSLMKDKLPRKAVDSLYLADKPNATAQYMLNDFPKFFSE